MDRSDNRALAERVAKLEALLIAKGLVAKDALDTLIDIYENDLGSMNGAKVVARAWVDPEFKQRLLQNAPAAIAELGFGGLQGEHLVIVENRRRCTTSWSARCAATHGPCSACRRRGTRTRRTVPVS